MTPNFIIASAVFSILFGLSVAWIRKSSRLALQGDGNAVITLMVVSMLLGALIMFFGIIFIGSVS